MKRYLNNALPALIFLQGMALATAEQAPVSLQLVDLTPRFLEFHQRAADETDPERRFELWKAHYDFVALPPGLPDRDERARAMLDAAWDGYDKVLYRIRPGIAALSPAPEPVLAQVSALLEVDDQLPAITLLYYVGMLDGNAFFAPAPDGSGLVALPAEMEPERRELSMAHEFAHAVHHSLSGLAMGPEGSVAGLVISEGIAMHATRALFPERADHHHLGGSKEWQQRCNAKISVLLTELAGHLQDTGPESVNRLTMGQGLTGMEREAYCAGWHLVGRLLTQGMTLAELARLEDQEVTDLLAETISEWTSAADPARDDSFGQLLKGLEHSLEQAVSSGLTPGVAAAIVSADEVLWQTAKGHHPDEHDRPIGPETVFSVQSISKNYTAVAIMLAVQDGILDLDLPISNYIDGFRINTPFDESPADKISLRHLLSHTAGFTHEAPVGNNFNAESESFDAHVASIAETWLRFPVGSRYAYSNLGIDLAAYILQEAVGMPFEDFMYQRLLQPIGAEHSFVDTPDRNGRCRRCSAGHHSMFASLPDYIPLTASGGVRTSLSDAIGYVQFHLNRGRVGDQQLLAPDLLDEIYRPTRREQAFGDDTVFPAHFFHGMGSYTFEAADTYAVGHTGGGFGFTASMQWYPEYGISMIILFNAGTDPLQKLELGWDMLSRMVEGNMVQRQHRPDLPTREAFFRDAPFDNAADTARASIPGEPAQPQGRLATLSGIHQPLFGGGFALSSSATGCFECIRIEPLEDRVLIHRGLPEPETLIRHAAGLYFADRSGELLDLRGPLPVWRSVVYQPQD